MRVQRRRLLVSAAAILGLLAPAAPAATEAAGATTTGATAQNQASQTQPRQPQPARPSPKHVTAHRSSPAANERMGRLGAQRESGRVVIAVKVRPGANDAVATSAVAGAARAQGGTQRLSLRSLDTVTVEVPKGTATAFAARMRSRQDVAKVDLVSRRYPSQAPNDPNYPAEASYLDAVVAPAAWTVHTSVPGVRIAVVDTGVDVNHPDLVGRIAETYNAVTGTTDVTDTMGHGTFVAGVAAATANNGIGITGASLGASILAVKVADSNDLIWTDAVAAGIIWAVDHQATVINLSLGSTSSDSVEGAAVAYAVAHGVVVVASAGNEANSTPNYPAAYPQVVAVGATNVATGGRAYFSSFGSWVTVAAPGVNITGTAPTSGSTFFDPDYDVANGTSFSSPIVAAEVALLSSWRPAATSADIRQAIVASSHGYGNLGLGTGQVDFKAAYELLSPTSAPTLTQPADGTAVAGVVQLSATSTAPKVGFTVNDKLVGTPVTTSGGMASATWASWGTANGPLNVTAVDCSLRDLCNAQATQMAVALANAAPVVTSPTASQMLTGSATLTATAPGGGVAFLIDGVRRGFDATAPYALTYPISLLSDTTHTISARGCSTSGTLCAGPASAPVSVTCRSVHPRITGLAPSLFSPNGDQRYDTTTVTYVLPDTEVVRFLVRSNTGTIVRSNLLGTLPAGTRAVAWNGLLNGGAPAGNGTYTLEIATTRGTLRGSAVAPVVVDNTRPTMTAIGGSATTFYPYPDAYRDRFAARATLSERARLTLSVHTTGGALVRALSGPLAGGATSITWDGKNTAGSRVPAGTYYWTLTAQDPAGNRRASARHTVAVNVSQLVTQTASLSRRGAQYFQAGGSDPTSSCASADKAHSGFAPNGVRLTNVCDFSVKGPQLAAAAFRFTLPAAISYSSLRLLTYGHSLSASTLGAGFTGWATGGFTLAPEITVGTASSWRAIGPVRAAGLVNAGRLVETTLYLPNEHPTNDYDVSDVRLIITYKVLG